MQQLTHVVGPSRLSWSLAKIPVATVMIGAPTARRRNVGGRIAENADGRLITKAAACLGAKRVVIKA